MKNNLSIVLSNVIKKAKELEENVSHSTFENKEKIELWSSSLKNKTQIDKSIYEKKKNSLKEDAILHWDEVKTNFKKGVVKVQSDFRKFKYDPKSGTPELRANWAEDDALLSIYIAIDALSNAEELIIIALKERAKAYSLK